MGKAKQRIEISEVEARQVFDEYFQPLRGYFENRGATSEEGDDLTQETLLRVYQGMKSFRQDSSLRTWIYVIAHNVWRSARSRAASRAVAAAVEPWPVALGEQGVEVPVDFADDANSPEDWTRERELDTVVNEALGQLAPGMRRCLELWLADFSYAEIAELLQMPVGTVKSHLHAAKKRLGQHLEFSLGESASP